ncbi:radical SAM protein [Solwaraspora sp. WMMD1047]|uniref:radical SAM protein n=1 Tax=Solwaraspora sp. WMMD1047 TaxID=3016102 RepID=UPI00241597BE|nr:radical SAM protein [Solwaraspora sp. WMMD1047]MDG4830011.1 radical SAM protein [Solwaraspora sp. WMMD1047]
MRRTFGAHGHLIHDPATGLTHRAPRPAPPGRLTLDDRDVTTWPIAPPAKQNRSTPLSICWSPLVRCNLHCPQCLDDTSLPEAGRPERHRIAGVLADADILGIDISGGEPLLLPDLADLARTVTAGGKAALSVTTNGWHLARRADELAEVIDAIRVSLDGPDPHSHDTIRGAGSFTRAIDGIHAARAAGLTVQTQMVLMNSTKTHAQRAIDLAAHLGVGGVTFLQMLPIGAAADLTAEMLTDAEATDILNRLDAPPDLRVRLRSREAASGFTVIRADGRVWRNSPHAAQITGLRPLHQATDLTLTGKDGSA